MHRWHTTATFCLGCTKASAEVWLGKRTLRNALNVEEDRKVKGKTDISVLGRAQW